MKLKNPIEISETIERLKRIFENPEFLQELKKKLLPRIPASDKRGQSFVVQCRVPPIVENRIENLLTQYKYFRNKSDLLRSCLEIGLLVLEYYFDEDDAEKRQIRKALDVLNMVNLMKDIEIQSELLSVSLGSHIDGIDLEALRQEILYLMKKLYD